MRPSRWERLKNDQRALAFAFLLPTLLVLAGVVVYPFLSAVWISFQAKQAGTPGRFVGLRNYAELFADPVFFTIVGNTMLYTGVAVAAKFVRCSSYTQRCRPSTDTGTGAWRTAMSNEFTSAPPAAAGHGVAATINAHSDAARACERNMDKPGRN